ncbi:unnamed protein product [Polarella glacialis]|uniref:Methyltransferase small domain-containing protein n=1 Tax=Polarella glacialis TaxID=89957 RepID=A0A813DS05_POLGL|nr:unnamed protein product [Polarella glacialis]CAE8690009.1 unnamed protein product [Polarella glacialis]
MTQSHEATCLECRTKDGNMPCVISRRCRQPPQSPTPSYGCGSAASRKVYLSAALLGGLVRWNHGFHCESYSFTFRTPITRAAVFKTSRGVRSGPANSGASHGVRRSGRRGPPSYPSDGSRRPPTSQPDSAPSDNLVAEARRSAPQAPPFAPGLLRPEPIPAALLRAAADTMLVDRRADWQEVANWVREGGRALVTDRWCDLEGCRALLTKSLGLGARAAGGPMSAAEAEARRTEKKKLSDRVLALVTPDGRIDLAGAPRADFLPTLYGDLLGEKPRFALPSGALMGLANSWQYFEGGLRFGFLAPPLLPGPVRPFYGVYATPYPVTHYELLLEWLCLRESESETQGPGPRTRSALDLGTGSGVVAMALHTKGGFQEVVACDVSPNAVHGARLEFERQGLSIEVVHSDLFDGLQGRSFDLVVFNPPWLPLPLPWASEEEPPRTELDLGNFYPDDLFDRLFDGLPRLLKPGGAAVILFSNHAVSRGYVQEHPLQAAFERSAERSNGSQEARLSLQGTLRRDFDAEGRRRRTGRPQASEPSTEPAAELWDFRRHPDSAALEPSSSSGY